MLGYSGDELPNTVAAWDSLLHPDDKEKAYSVMQEYLKTLGHGTYTNEFRMHAKDGSWRWIEARGKAVFNNQGDATRFVGFNADITEKKENELILEHAARYDILTNLPNRYMLSIFMPQMMASVKRHKTHLALLFIDLDGFKAVNDSHGHAVGDKLLKEVATRMKELTRENDFVVRLGGDEFAMIISDLNERDEIKELISRLLITISNPYIVDNLEHKVSASIGVSFYPQTEDVDEDTLLLQSDKAMYHAKLYGKNQYCLFDDLAVSKLE